MKPTIYRVFILISCLWISTGFDFETSCPSSNYSSFSIGPDGVTYSVAVSPTGEIYVGGQFTTLDNGLISANNIAKWNGSTWEAVGSGTNNIVRAIDFDSAGNMYIGGSFTIAGGITVNRLAMWDGTNWSAMGTGANNQVFELAVAPDDQVYIGGLFTQVDGTSSLRVSRWDGTNWNPMSSGANGTVTGLDVAPNGDVYICGGFNLVGGVSAIRAARWDGSNWSGLGTGIAGTVSELATAPDGSVYFTGFFSAAGGMSGANGVAKWDGTNWSFLGTGIGNTDQGAAITVDAFGQVYVGGGFSEVGGISANNIAVWDGLAWCNLGAGTSNSGAIFDVTTDIAGEVYMVGSFLEAGGLALKNIAQYGTVSLSADLIEFQALALDRSVQLDWSTATENQSSGFGIQRSQDGTNWGTIGYLEASGESQIKREYQFVDEHPLGGQSYYRLAIESFTGETDYSEIREIKRSEKTELILFPNPGNGTFYIQGLEGTAPHYQLFDPLGRLLKSGQLLQPNLDLSELPDGHYLLLVEQQSIRLIKQ